MSAQSGGTVNLLYWVDAEEPWMTEQGFKEWRCYCGCEVEVIWTTSHQLLDTDETLGPDNPNVGSWELKCHNGHVLLSCHEIGEDESADVYLSPTTEDIVKRLATAEDVAAWRAYEQPKPPWTQLGSGVGS